MKVKAIVYSDPEELEERVNTVIDGKKNLSVLRLKSVT
jgi:hypothetical protein